MYKTIGATIDRSRKIILDDNFELPEDDVKVLVTFLGTEKTKSNNIERLYGSDEVLGTNDHKKFIEILKSA